MSIAQTVTFVVLMVTAAASEEASFKALMSRRLAGCDDKHADVCKCIMGCEVNGGDGGDCTDDKVKNAELTTKAMMGAITDAKKMCDLYMCMAYCAKSLDCLDDEFKAGCNSYKKTSEEAGTKCDVDCDAAKPAAVFGLTTLLSVMVMMQF